jgi:hypothetical protein
MLFLSCFTILPQRPAKTLLIYAKRSMELGILEVKFIGLFQACTYKVDVSKESHQCSKMNLSMSSTQRLDY